MKTLDDVRLEAYRLSARRLEDQTNSALAADQRAMSVAGLGMAAAAILCGLAPSAGVPLALLFGSVFLLTTTGLAWFSARPVDFFMPGASYRDFDADLKNGKPAVEVLDEMGRNNDKSSDKNEQTLKRNAQIIGAALYVAVIGLLIAILPQLCHLLLASCN